MLKFFAVLFFVPSLLLFFVSEKPKHISNSFPTPSPIKMPRNENTPANVEKMILDNEKIYLWCPYSVTESGVCSKSGMKIKVMTQATDKENDILIYRYKISDGKILGQGKEVIWDLFGARVGEHKITVEVDDGNNLGKSVSRIVEIRECECCYLPCECPTINVLSSKKDARNGETVEFKAEVKGGSQTKIDYNWTVEGGVIIEGQGSPNIKVQILTNQYATATIEIGGLCETCIQTASESITLIR